MVKLVYTLVSDTSELSSWRFKSSHPHQVNHSIYAHLYSLCSQTPNKKHPGIGSYGGPGTGGIALSYSFASNSCSTLSSPKTIAPGIGSLLGTVYKFTFSTNGCSTATNIGRYVWLHYTLDDSQTATFPDINSNHTTINNYTIYYHPATTNRLRGGATFSNGSLQTLDAPP